MLTTDVNYMNIGLRHLNFRSKSKGAVSQNFLKFQSFHDPHKSSSDEIFDLNFWWSELRIFYVYIA